MSVLLPSSGLAARVARGPLGALTGRCQPPDRLPWYLRHLAPGLDFRVLGPLEVWEGDRQLRLGGVKQRSVLAMLLLNAGEVVSSDRLIDALWGDDPPDDAQTALQQHVSRLRKLLGDPEQLVTRAPGYVLHVPPAMLDLRRFEQLRDRGRSLLAEGRPAEAAQALRTALELWRGRSLADLEHERFAVDAARDLEEARLDALESRIDAELAAGGHDELIGELRGLVRDHPLRERAWAQLMLALYRSGRQAEALEAYSEARRTLVEEVGLEPGPELQHLQRSILAHAQELALPHRLPLGRRRALVPLIAALVLVTGSALAAAAWLGRNAEPAATTPISGGYAVAVDSRSGDIVRRIPAGRTPAAIAARNGVVWLVDGDARTLVRVETASRVVETLSTGATPLDVAVDARSVWVVNGRRLASAQLVGPIATSVARYDAATRTERAQIDLPRPRGTVSNVSENRVAVSAGALWVVLPDFAVARIDRTSGAITARTDAVRAAAVASGAAGVWVLGVDGAVARLDERTAQPIDRAKVPAPSVASIAVGADAAWVTSPSDGSLWRIGGGRVASLGKIDLRPGTTDVAVGESGVSVVNPSAGTLTQVDPDTATVVRTVRLQGIPRALAVDGDHVWVAVAAGPGAGVTDEVSGVRTFPANMCEPVVGGPDGRADVLVTSDFPLQGGGRLQTGQMSQAIAFVLREHGYRAGRFRVAYQSCDDSVGRTGLYDDAKCEANARAYAGNPDVVGVIGTFNSACALIAVPVLNRARDGPLAMISPVNSLVGLTRPGVGVDPSLPAALYPTGRRNYVRVYPTDDLQGAALALFARDRGRRRVFVLDDGEPGWGRVMAEGFVTAAGRVGLTVVGRATWDPRARSYAALAGPIARSGADAVVLGGLLDSNAARVVRDLRERLGPSIDLFGDSGLTPLRSLVEQAGRASHGMHVSLTGVVTDRFPPAGARFVARFGRTQGGAPVEPSSVYAAQATEVLLTAIARSDGTRRSVLRELFRTRVKSGLLGSFRFDRNGDITESPITIVRVAPGARPPTAQSVDTGVVVRVLRPSSRLVATER